jgi:hypothetical protein
MTLHPKVEPLPEGLRTFLQCHIPDPQAIHDWARNWKRTRFSKISNPLRFHSLKVKLGYPPVLEPLQIEGELDVTTWTSYYDDKLFAPHVPHSEYEKLYLLSLMRYNYDYCCSVGQYERAQAWRDEIWSISTWRYIHPLTRYCIRKPLYRVPEPLRPSLEHVSVRDIRPNCWRRSWMRIRRLVGL